MTGRWPRRGQSDEDGEGIKPVTTLDLAKLPLSTNPSLTDDGPRALIMLNPGLSVWHPASGEYILVAPWRNRSDIVTVGQRSAIRHESVLIDAAIEESRRAGKAAFVLMETFERRRPAYYKHHEMTLFESILTYEHPAPRLLLTDEPDELEFVEWFGEPGPARDAVKALDANAFPWLWRNADREFEAYMLLPFTVVQVGCRDGEPVCYIGMTHFQGWSHLDRIAVTPSMQGQGIGKSALRFAVRRMIEAGATRIGLSTQKDNLVSRRMYQRAGFQPTPENDYDIYGTLFDAGREAMRVETDRGTSGT